jgi:hypothetical protein
MTEREKLKMLEYIAWLETTKGAWFFSAMLMLVINLITVPYALTYILKYGFKL